MVFFPSRVTRVDVPSHLQPSFSPNTQETSNAPYVLPRVRCVAPTLLKGALETSLPHLPCCFSAFLGAMGATCDVFLHHIAPQNSLLCQSNQNVVVCGDVCVVCVCVCERILLFRWRASAIAWTSPPAGCASPSVASATRCPTSSRRSPGRLPPTPPATPSSSSACGTWCAGTCRATTPSSPTSTSCRTRPWLPRTRGETESVLEVDMI